MKRWMQFGLFALCMLIASPWARGQNGAQAPFGLEMGQAAPLQVGVQYQATHANAPPGQCGCFWMQGGGVQVLRSFRSDLGLMADVYYGSNAKINGTDEQISIFNYVFGPRYTYRTSTRYTPYAQLLAGASKVSSNYYVYKSNNTYFAGEVGTGVEVYLTPRISAVPLEANWVYSHALNGVNTRQNNLRVGVGVVYRLGPR